MGTEIFKIGPGRAEKKRFKDFNLDSKIIINTQFYHPNFPLKKAGV